MLKITKKYSVNRQKCPPLSLLLFLFTFLPKLTNDFSNSKKTQCHFGAVCNIQMSYVSAVQDRLVLLFNIISYRDSKLLRPVIILWQAKKKKFVLIALISQLNSTEVNIFPCTISNHTNMKSLYRSLLFSTDETKREERN